VRAGLRLLNKLRKQRSANIPELRALVKIAFALVFALFEEEMSRCGVPVAGSVSCGASAGTISVLLKNQVRDRKSISSAVSFPRRRESRHNRWTPAYAGVTVARSSTFADA